MPISGTATFFRVLSSVANPPAIQVTISNFTGESFLAIVQPRTNADLWLSGPTNLHEGDAIVCQENVLKELDVAWDGGGGFRLLDRSGGPTLNGGFFLINQGPGANQVTYTGMMTNPVGSASFSAVTTTTTTAGKVRVQDDISQDLGQLAGGLQTAGFFASPTPEDCPAVIAAKRQQHANLCTLQGPICFFSTGFPPKGPYCRFTPQITLKTNTATINGKLVTWVRAVVCDGISLIGCCKGPGDPDPSCK
jgi:hypothetical protein